MILPSLNHTVLGDTGEQWMFPKSGIWAESEKAPVFIGLMSVLGDYGRSLILWAVLVSFLMFQGIFFTGDTGAHGKDFGKILRSTFTGWSLLTNATKQKHKTMSELKDIRFRKKGALVTVRIKVGADWVDRSGGWRTIAEATAPAIQLRDKLRGEYEATHPTASQENGELTTRLGKSLRVCATEALAAYARRQRLRTTKNIESSLRWAWKTMGDKAELPPKVQTKSTFTKLRDALLDGEGLQNRTRELYSKNLRRVFGLIPTLNQEFLHELENLPRTGSTARVSGDAFHTAHFQTMFNRIANADDTTQGLFWVGASGGPQIVDTVFIPFRAVDWTTGRIHYWRIKTHEEIDFYALPPLLEWLKRRRTELGSEAVYAFPELIYLNRELTHPECNTTSWEGFKTWKNGEVPQSYAVRGAMYGLSRMSAFLKSCGIKTDGITHKSFRKHNISFWASIGIKLTTRMLMAGHSRLEAHQRYDVPAQFEMVRARDILWKYYQAIMKGEEFFIPTTPYDIYEAIKNENAQLREQLSNQRQELQTLASKLDTLISLQVSGGKGGPELEQELLATGA
jgi:hypothetical protein